MAEDSAQPLAVSEHTETRMAGSYAAGELVVSFAATTPRQYLGEVALRVAGKDIASRVDALRGSIAIDLPATSLLPAEIDGLASFYGAILEYLGDVADVELMHESLLVRTAALMAVAPSNALLPDVSTFVDTPFVQTSNGDDGKTCIKAGETRTAWFDGSKGTTSQNWVVDSTGATGWECMGHCGAGCGRNYDYTLDCLDHDACGLYYRASGGSSDPNCGDEWSNASGDYLNFFKRCNR